MYVEPRTYFWSYLLSWGLTVSGGALAVVSVLAFFNPDLIGGQTARDLCIVAFASIVGFSVACANCTASAAQHAISRRFNASVFWPAIICTAGFCVTTSIGVHLGWALMTDDIGAHALPDGRIVNGAAVFIALAKPAMNWIIEGRKAIDHGERCAVEAAEEVRLSATREAERSLMRDAVQPFRPDVAEGGRSVSQVDRGRQISARTAADAASRVVVDQPVVSALPQPQRADASASVDRLLPSSEMHARTLLQAGKKQREVARETGLTRYRVSQIMAGRTSVATTGTCMPTLPAQCDTPAPA